MNRFARRLATVFSYLAAATAMMLVLSALPQHAAPNLPAKEIVLGIDPRQSTVHWTLGSTVHTVHGTFALKNGTVRVDPDSGKASGEIVVLATSGDSGNDGRDKKMHKEVLESWQYPEVVFRPDRVEGKIAPQGTFIDQVHGIFVLHGKEHELSLPVQAEFAGDHWTGTAKFDIPFIDWGLKNPSNFLLKVNHSVEIELELKGTLESVRASAP